MNPDKMPTKSNCVEFAQHFIDSGKPTAVIYHSSQLLIETDAFSGRTVTVYLLLKTNLKNAGVQWGDKEVATDNGLVTSRSPKHPEAFNKKMMKHSEKVFTNVNQALKSKAPLLYAKALLI